MFKFKLLNKEDGEYEVFFNGIKIGRVYKMWLRNGGNCWGNNLRGGIWRAGETRQEAAKDLLRLYNCNK